MKLMLGNSRMVEGENEKGINAQKTSNFEC